MQALCLYTALLRNVANRAFDMMSLVSYTRFFFCIPKLLSARVIVVATIHVMVRDTCTLVCISVHLVFPHSQDSFHIIGTDFN